MKPSRIVATFAVCAILAVPAAPVRAGDPAGRWGGTWCSSTNGHHGKIHARVCQVDANTYRVRFTGTFLGAVPFTYSVPMTVTSQGTDGRTYLSGQSRLPLFGNFCCQAEVTACDFTASYTSSRDEGQFNMRRR